MPLKHTVEELVLKNGARGLLINVPDTTAVGYGIAFRAGNSYVKSPDLSQVAHIMEHMAFGPNEKFPSLEEFSQDFTKNGATRNAHTGSIAIEYAVNAALMEWDRILDLQLLAVAKPIFTQQNLTSEKKNVREEITGYGNNHGRVLMQTIWKKAGINRWFDPDELKTIDTVTLQDIREHYGRTHTSENLRFIFAGDLAAHKDTIVEKLSTIELPKGQRLELPLDVARHVGPVHVHRQDMQSLAFNIRFFLNRELTRRELRAMNVLCYVLTDTLHSRIFGKARIRGLCYSMGSGYSTEPTQLSEFGFGGQVSEENASELIKLITSELVEVAKNGITQEELLAAKANKLGSMQMATQTVGSLISWYATDYYDNERIDSVDLMPALIDGTTDEEIRGLVREFINSGMWAFGEIGNISEDTTNAHSELLSKALEKKW